MKLVDAIKARVEAATPGPLEVRPAKLSGIKTKYLDVDISREEAWDEWVTLPPSDALLFAHASTDIEVLLRVVRAAKRVTLLTPMGSWWPEVQELKEVLAILDAEVEE